MTETARIWLAFYVLITLVSLAVYLTGCTSTQLANYEKSVDSRSIEGYAKDSNGNPQGGVKYTVHYR